MDTITSTLTHPNAIPDLTRPSPPPPFERTQFVWSASRTNGGGHRTGLSVTEQTLQVTSAAAPRQSHESVANLTSRPSMVQLTSPMLMGKSRQFEDESDDRNQQLSVPETPSLRSTISSPPSSAKSTLPGGVVTTSNRQQATNSTAATHRLNPSFYSHLSKLESWSNLVGFNLLASNYALDSLGHWRAVGHSRVLIYSIRAFLAWYLLQVAISYALVSDEDWRTMLYAGDFTNIYGVHVDRYAFNAFRLFWGLHAAVVYWWVTRANGHIRVWLYHFEARWLETMIYVNPELEGKSLVAMRGSRRFATRFIHVVTVLATALSTALNTYGYFSQTNRSQHPELWTDHGTALYFAWCAIHTIWFWLTFVVNLTAFGHHYLFCRAIHIRFDETRHDLEYAILSEWSYLTRPDQLTALITKHYYVCDMVKQANRHLKYYLFIFYVVFGPHLCLMIYQVIFSSSATAQGRAFIVALVILSDLVQVYFVSVLSAQIITKAHDAYFAMHGVNKFDMPERLQLQSTLFMQRISNTVVGLTILDSFVLTGGLLSSLATAVVTYFSVILESA